MTSGSSRQVCRAEGATAPDIRYEGSGQTNGPVTGFSTGRTLQRGLARRCDQQVRGRRTASIEYRAAESEYRFGRTYATPLAARIGQHVTEYECRTARRSRHGRVARRW